MTAVTPAVTFRVRGASTTQEASLVVGHRAPVVDDQVLVERLDDEAGYVLVVPR